MRSESQLKILMSSYNVSMLTIQDRIQLPEISKRLGQLHWHRVKRFDDV